MKHIVLIITMLILIVGLGAVNYQLSGGVDFNGVFTSKIDGYKFGMYMGTEVNATLSAQAMNKRNNLYYGLGVDYQLPRVNSTLPEGWTSSITSVSFIPVYATLIYQFPTISATKPEIIGQIGYSFTDLEFIPSSVYDEEYSTENGLYIGLGFGVQKDKICAQAIYKVSKGKITETDWDKADDDERSSRTYGFVYSMFSLSLGYRF